MTEYKSIDDLDVRDKRVLVRVDFNVPMAAGAVADATRIERAVPTISELVERGAKVAVLSHLGRPRGRVAAELSLRPVATALGAALGGRPVNFAADCVGPVAEEAIAAMSAGDVVVLENLRFHEGEEANDAAFASVLATLGDLYVNDAFSCAHRIHASVVALARLLPAAAGRLMQAELEALGKALERPEHPLVAVIGGAKVSGKLEVLVNLENKVDVLVIGGGMANTFLNAKGVGVGRSLCEHDMATAALDVIAGAERAGCEIVLPVDAVVARELAEGAAGETVTVDRVPADSIILDIGPRSVADLETRLEGWRTLVWNGPLGAFEVSPFDAATTAFARAVAARTRSGHLLSVAGGGDTIAALSRAGVEEDLSYVSTAGGAFLEWIEGKELPGVAALEGGDV